MAGTISLDIMLYDVMNIHNNIVDLAVSLNIMLYDVMNIHSNIMNGMVSLTICCML